MDSWSAGRLRPLSLDQIGQTFRSYRLPVASAQREMAQSLRSNGQLSPVVVCLREDRPQLIDGFTRLSAAESIAGLESLSARVIEADDRQAKALMYSLNRVGRRPHELEEAWLVHALVREDGLSQVETGGLLGRHKSWVCRRLALIEKLAEPIREELGLGLVPLASARELARLPAGNQEPLLKAARRDSLTSEEMRRVVELLLERDDGQHRFILHAPRQAVEQTSNSAASSPDPRLGRTGREIHKQLGLATREMNRLERRLRSCEAPLSSLDAHLLEASLERFGIEARAVAELVDDLRGEN